MQRRVLIADDNPAVRKTLRHLLEESGSYEVADAEDGQSALARAIEFHPDVIILDLAMPVMDGLSAAREISRVLPEAAILMYTMHWSSQLELEAKKCGVRMLVSKAQSTILLTAVQEILAAKDLESAPAATDSSLTSKTAAQSAPDPPVPKFRFYPPRLRPNHPQKTEFRLSKCPGWLHGMKTEHVGTILTGSNLNGGGNSVSSEPTRRTFLRLSAAGLAAAATTDWTEASTPAPEGEISVHVTGGTLRHAPAPSISWRIAPTTVSNPIALFPDKKHQQILGFGAAFTDASCYVFNQLPQTARDTLFHELFHPSEMGLSVCRTCMGSSDYSTEVFSYDEGEPDPEMKRFSIAHDKAYVLPMTREARKANPELFLFSSPWSPPGWMKAGGSMLGGSMRSRYYAPYAQYFLKFVQAYASEGVQVQAVTVQNEVDTDQDGRMPACSWPQEYEIAFVKNHLGPLFQKNGISTKIWVLDHNYNLWGRAVAELDDPDVRKYCDSVAFHGYVGKPEMMSMLHEAHPNANIYWTEGGPDYTAPDYATDWAKWTQTFSGILRNWAQSITGWNLALDEKGRPNIGPFPCGGLVTINSQSKEISRSGQYWAFAHFSRHIRRGAKRFESAGSLPDIDHVAFENPDGKKVLVVANTGEAHSIVLQQTGRIAEFTLPAKSVSTFEWN